PPPGWNKEGFIYAQLAVDGFYSTCIDPQTGTEKLIQDCDPSAGDIARKYGNLNPGSRRAILNISSSINFFEGNTDLLVISGIIQVTSPQPYQQIASPITIMGEAAKAWFNKSEFPVILTDAEYQIMARGNAKSIGKSTNQDFILFELSLDYKNPLHDNGYIILRRANTSGKPEQDRSIIIPITFSSVY
ncbi:MAG: Gmad2 immunoglobulin-like domain-containing protein, partial [Bacteroidota bacterium]|nr:Gmad2 immunoglobulin-like domain-containing protein [Bacteroidota bacterium]